MLNTFVSGMVTHLFSCCQFGFDIKISHKYRLRLQIYYVFFLGNFFFKGDIPVKQFDFNRTVFFQQLKYCQNILSTAEREGEMDNTSV